MVNKENNIQTLEEAAENYRRKSCNAAMIPPLDGPTNEYGGSVKDAFISGAKWMRKKDVEDMYMSDNRHFIKCYEQGKVDMRVAMMKDAVDGEIVKDISNMLAVTAKNINLDGFKFGDKVKIIIVKEDDRPRD